MTGKQLGNVGLNEIFNAANRQSPDFKQVLEGDKSDLPGDRQTMIKVPLGYKSTASGGTWGSRASGIRGGSRNNVRKSW